MRAPTPSRHVKESSSPIRVKAAVTSVVGAVTAVVVYAATSEGVIQALVVPHG
jgi:hypothetical protein